MAEAYIVTALRTAGGRRGGRLANVAPVDLAADVINAILARTGIDGARVDDVILGCVTQVNEQAINIGRNAVLASNLPRSVPGTTIDRQCGSSQQAIHFASQAVISGTADVIIAGGVESMTRVPMFSSLPNTHYQVGRLRERYPQDFSQFVGAEMMARKYGLPKLELDQYALQSHLRAAAAIDAGAFDDEIVPVAIRDTEGQLTGEMHTVDEGVRRGATLEGIQGVKLLNPDGVISAANASQITDGASGCLVVSERGLKDLGLTPVARIHHMSVLADDPVIMLEAPIPATRRALEKAGMRMADIDLFEVNEAFASVPLAWARELDDDPARLNVNGGAIALGHPLGASGARLMATLVNALGRRGKRYGLQTMCEGGGMANVTIVERL